MSSNSEESKRPQTTLYSQRTAGKFNSGDLHPNYIPDASLVAQMQERLLSTTRKLTGQVQTRGSHRLVEAICEVCKRTRWVYVAAIRRGQASCPCQKGKYKDPRAHSLGARYDAMVQRCERDTHVSSENYKGRGIKVLFQSREHFIRWALAAYPETDFKGLDFDRINNDGHYEPGNMRLVSRSFNLLNRRKRGGEYCKNGHPLLGGNLYLHPRGQRVCRACMRQYGQAFRDRRRAARLSTTC